MLPPSHSSEPLFTDIMYGSLTSPTDMELAKGAYVIVDGSYHRWVATMSPSHLTSGETSRGGQQIIYICMSVANNLSRSLSLSLSLSLCMAFQVARVCEQLESVRKDINCLFGVLEGRFRILKLPMSTEKDAKLRAQAQDRP